MILSVKKIFFYFIFFICFQLNSLAQLPATVSSRHLSRTDSLISQRLYHIVFPNRGSASDHAGSFYSATIKDNKSGSIKPSQRVFSNPTERIKGLSCFDTSLRLVYKKPPLNWIATDYLTKTRDGNILMPGFDYDYTNQITSAHLIKLTQQGDTLWSKSIQGGYKNQFMDVYKAFELNDNSILLVGDIDVPMPVNGRSDFLMMRVSATGNLIWQKTFQSKLWAPDSTNGSINIYNCIQDAAGNMYICGDIRYFGPPRQCLDFKMDLSGNILWSKAFATLVYPVLSGVNITGNTVSFTGTGITDYNNEIVMFGITQEQATGDTISMTRLRPGNNDFWHSFYGYNTEKLNNGNLALFGFGPSEEADAGNNMVTHAGMVELTPDLHFVKSYLFRSLPSPLNISVSTTITVFPDGSASYCKNIFNDAYHTGYRSDLILGNFNNGQVLKERTIPYRGLGISWVSNFIQMDDGGQVVTQLFGDSATQESPTEFLKLHNSDTSGSCLGNDTSSTIIEKQTFYNDNLYVDSIVTEVLTENKRPFKGIYNDNFIIESNCKQVSFCDSLKLLTPQNTICANNPVNITVRKNKECGSLPLWTYDTTAVASFYEVNDSTRQITFNGPWQGYIHAAINGCTILEDSLKFTVLLSQAKLDLGPDTVICPGNIILLNAGRGYASYQWQDGSVDSLYIVKQPGIYFVKTTDGCSGNIFTDTVVVSPHPPIPFYIGPDTTVCKNGSLHITAPSGFLHYEWFGNNISTDTTASVDIMPVVNTLYKVVAEQSPGCFAIDSLYISVKNLPPVHLGNDTSFCMNQSVILDAGMGFDTYQWNTGDVAEKIKVSFAGIFSVQATLNGCTAYDTLQVIKINPLPFFSLGSDTALCAGQQISYSFNLQNVVYKWNNGSTLNNQTIKQAGTYWLQATSNAGCIFRDTANIIFNYLPVLNLGNDTTICEKQTLLLNAYNNNATYYWQDGSTSQAYTVKNSGIYYVIANVNNCTASDTISVNYKALPSFTLGSDTVICTGQPLVLHPFLNTNANYLWQDGSSANSITIQNEGIYFLTASNECGGFTDSISVVTHFCDIMMPNAFTPNRDGVNDIFRVKYPFPSKKFNIKIYDRWGEKVFETNSMNNGWDGTSKGADASQGAYVWIIDFTDINNKRQSMRGVVILLR